MKKTLIISALVLGAVALLAWSAVGAPFGSYGMRGRHMGPGMGMQGYGYQNAPANLAVLPAGADVKATPADKGVTLTITAVEAADVTAIQDAYKAALEGNAFSTATSAAVTSKTLDKGVELTVTSEDPATVQWLQFHQERIALHVLHGMAAGPGWQQGARGPGVGRRGPQGQSMMNGMTPEQMQALHDSMQNMTPEQRQAVMQGLMQNQNRPMMGRGGAYGRGMGNGPGWNFGTPAPQAGQGPTQ